MSYLAVLTLTAFITLANFSEAAIDCKPGMGNCPTTGYQSGPTPPHVPHEESRYLSISYTEVAAPNCGQQELFIARSRARMEAIREAQMNFNTVRIVELPGGHWSQRCGQGMYASSIRGNAWIVQYFAYYEKP